jgi:hypothetical protein
LESDPVLAAPWHQLFRQVQSPRHVLSELLQNADDAKATWARATINNNVFEFTHNGEDFDEETLQSLCQFGLSNKRHLHTIGFRGVGFKSVFSLGPQVEIITPTLTFGFRHKRFTEPMWLELPTISKGETIIRVAIGDEQKVKTLQGEFNRWVKSPIPLLFFNYIDRLEIHRQVIHKGVLRHGPVNNSEYVRLSNGKKLDVLVFNSEPLEFPKEALEEIRDERGSTELDLPPCTVQIVLNEGSDQFLYTVLPTDVKPLLPFSFNGPFIQDPSRREIKHPVNSPTNRWFLHRVGQLAAETMTTWLENQNLNLKERAHAYELLPKLTELEGEISQVCVSIIDEEFKKHFDRQPRILLGHDGTLTSKDTVIALPDAVLQTWSPEQALNIFAPQRKKVLSSEIPIKFLESLKSWGFITDLDRKAIATRLISTSQSKPSCPEPLEGLIYLWAYLQPLGLGEFRDKISELAIVPAAGKKELLPATQVMVLGGKEWDVSGGDKTFLMSWVDIVDPEWVKLMAHRDGDKAKQHYDHASDLFNKLNLNQRVGMEQIIAAAAKKIFSVLDDPGEAGIKLAQIAAASDARIQNDFKFLCQDGCWRLASNELLIQYKTDLESLLPTNIFKQKVISYDYEKSLSFKDLESWRAWTRDFEKSKLCSFPVPSPIILRVWKYHSDISTLCIERGGNAPNYFPYESRYFRIEDFDWGESIWDEWQDISDENPDFLREILLAVFQNWSKLWEDRLNAKVHQEGQKYYRPVPGGNLRSAWLQKLRNLSCIPDVFGKCNIPSQLYRRTPDTEPLFNVENFVRPDFDKPEYAKILDLLGVRNQPRGIEPLFERLKALSKTKTPPITHLVDLYRALDRVLLRMDVKETYALKRIFNEDPLIFTDASDWEKLKNVFRENPEDIPGVRLIHPEAVTLSMWDRMEVSRRPTLQMAIAWLKSKPLGESLSKADRERALQILRRASGQAWYECQAWLDVTGRWISRDDLKWFTSSSQIVSGLFSSFKKQTADLSMLDGASPDFFLDGGIISLDKILEHKLQEDINIYRKVENPSWLVKLSDILMRLRRPTGNEVAESIKSQYESDHNLANRLRETKWQPVLNLKVVPYIDGQQAGSPIERKVIWQGGTIYVQGSPPTHHRELVEELSRHFQTSEVKKIITDCVDRNPEWIEAYANENLDLGEAFPVEVESPEPTSEEGEEKTLDVSTVIVKGGRDEIPGKAQAINGGEEIDTEEDKGKIQPRPSIGREDFVKKGFESFVLEKGFIWSKQHEYYVSDDETIIRKAEPPFKWGEYNASGEAIASYWIGHGSMEDGVEIPAEIWNQTPKENQEIYLILIDKGLLCSYRLSQLKQKAKTGEIESYPTRMIIRSRELSPI